LKAEVELSVELSIVSIHLFSQAPENQQSP